MAQTGSRRGAAENTSLILAVLAFVAIGGLIYWLNVTAEPTATAVVPQDTADEEPVSDVPIVDLGSIRQETEGYLGLEVELRNQNVTSTLGGQAFWIGSQDNPFLVKVDSAVSAAQPGTGDTVNVRGFIHEMSDSVLDAWEAQGAIAGSGERAVASFAEVFLQAMSVRNRSGGGGGQGAGGASDTTSQGAGGGEG